MADNKCDCNAVMQEVVDDIKNNMFSEEEINGVSNLFKVLGDPTRAKIVMALDKREVCVCDLAAALGMTKSAVSHQLALLKANNIVKARRDGKHVFYSPEYAKTLFGAFFTFYVKSYRQKDFYPCEFSLEK